MTGRPYLETCCRAALHHLCLCGDAGRPAEAADAPCLRRLTAMGLCRTRSDGRIAPTPLGQRRHEIEILIVGEATMPPRAGRQSRVVIGPGA